MTAPVLGADTALLAAVDSGSSAAVRKCSFSTTASASPLFFASGTDTSLLISACSFEDARSTSDGAADATAVACAIGGASASLINTSFVGMVGSPAVRSQLLSADGRGSVLSVTDATFSELGSSGSVFAANGAALHLLRVNFTGIDSGSAAYQVAAVRAASGSTLVATDCAFSNLTTGHGTGGAALAVGAASANVMRCTFERIASPAAPVVQVRDLAASAKASVVFRDCVWRNVSAGTDSSALLIIKAATPVTLTGGSFSGTRQGPAVRVEDSPAEVAFSGVRFAGNGGPGVQNGSAMLAINSSVSLEGW